MALTSGIVGLLSWAKMMQKIKNPPRSPGAAGASRNQFRPHATPHPRNGTDHAAATQPGQSPAPHH